MKYEVEEQDIEKLSQLDRIEYRQNLYILKEENSPDISILILTFVILVFVGVVEIVYFLNGLEIPRTLDIAYYIAYYFGVALVLLYFFTVFFCIFKKRRKIEKLNEKYFDTEINPKKRK